MENKSESIKLRIRDRYSRLRHGDRRPSFEYISPENIRTIFAPYVVDKEKFQNMSDQELLDLYSQWHQKYVINANKEVFLPELEET